MPHQEVSHRPHKACLWATDGTADDYGQTRISDDAEEIRVCWNSKRTEMLDPQGNTIMVDATAEVAQKIPVGSVMWRGNKADLPAGSSFHEEDYHLMEVKAEQEVFDIKGRACSRTVGLMRFRDKLPRTT